MRISKWYQKQLKMQCVYVRILTTWCPDDITAACMKPFEDDGRYVYFVIIFVIFENAWCATGISSWTNTFYSLYTASIKCHKTLSSVHQIYADDTQIYKSCRPSEIVHTINSIEQCISNVKTWMLHNKLQMNDDKTEAILLHKKDWQLNTYLNQSKSTIQLLTLCLCYKT